MQAQRSVSVPVITAALSAGVGIGGAVRLEVTHRKFGRVRRSRGKSLLYLDTVGKTTV